MGKKFIFQTGEMGNPYSGLQRMAKALNQAQIQTISEQNRRKMTDDNLEKPTSSTGESDNSTPNSTEQFNEEIIKQIQEFDEKIDDFKKKIDDLDSNVPQQQEKGFKPLYLLIAGVVGVGAYLTGSYVTLQQIQQNSSNIINRMNNTLDNKLNSFRSEINKKTEEKLTGIRRELNQFEERLKEVNYFNTLESQEGESYYFEYLKDGFIEKFSIPKDKTKNALKSEINNYTGNHLSPADINVKAFYELTFRAFRDNIIDKKETINLIDKYQKALTEEGDKDLSIGVFKLERELLQGMNLLE